MKKKEEKIVNNIVLSIKYARLKEEADDAETKKRELAEKKKLVGSIEKKIDKSNQFIESVNAAIGKIEESNNPNTYSLVVGNGIKEQLKLLSKQKDFELIKYGIALETIMDNDFEYTDNTNVDFLENISVILFDDKKVIAEMKEDYKEIKTRIYGTTFGTRIEEATATLISKIPISKWDNASAPQKVVTVVGVAATAIGDKFLKKRKHARKLSTLEAGDFANKLIIKAMNLLYAKEHIESEAEYQNYSKSELEEINIERNRIAKEMFEEHSNVEENRLMLELLQNFDSYLLEQLDLNDKKRGKKNA